MTGKMNLEDDSAAGVLRPRWKIGSLTLRSLSPGLLWVYRAYAWLAAQVLWVTP